MKDSVLTRTPGVPREGYPPIQSMPLSRQAIDTDASYIF